MQASVLLQTPDPQTVKLPPGTYRVMDQMTMRPRENIEPIALKAGEVRSITYAPPAKQPSSPLTTQICYWTSDGVLVTGGQGKLVDESGEPQERAGHGGVGALYLVAPGRYKAILDRPGREPHVREITVGLPGTSDTDKTAAGRFSPVHIVLK